MSPENTKTSLTLIIMATAPQSGAVQARMVSALGAEGAVELAREMLELTIAAAVAAGVGEVEVCASPNVDSPVWSNIRWPAGIRFSEQNGDDPGERMSLASEPALRAGRSVLLMGTDCPQMSAELVQRAAQQLKQAEAVLHPTRDGGCALLGLRHHYPELLRDLPWSTEEVCAVIQERLQALGCTLIVSDLLRELDEPGDLQH